MPEFKMSSGSLRVRLALPPPKQLNEYPAEILVDFLKILRKNGFHLFGERCDQPGQLIFGTGGIAHLLLQKLVPLGDFLVLFNGGEVHRSQRLDFVLDGI